MPQTFRPTVITNAGKELMLGSAGGRNGILFTRIGIGEGIYAESEKTIEALEVVTALKVPKNTYDFTSGAEYDEGKVKVTATITNYDDEHGTPLITIGYYMTEMGVFAKGSPDGEEVLYGISVIDGNQGEYIPPYDGFSPMKILQEFAVKIDNQGVIEVNYSSSAFATAEDFGKLNSAILAIRNGFVFDDHNGLIIDFQPASNPVMLPEISGGYTPYVLPVATADRLGGVKIGRGIDVTGDGTITPNVDTSAEAAAEIAEEQIASATNDLTPGDIDDIFSD